MSRVEKASLREATQPPRWLRALLVLISALLVLGGCAAPPGGGVDEPVGSAQQAIAVPAPTITSFTPASGAPGDVVLLSGTGFTGTTGVKLGKIAVAFTFESDVLITATVPAGALNATFSVTKASGTATSAATFLVTPTLTSFTPASGTQGTAVTLKGKNLLDTTAVSFGGVPASITSTTATSVVATVPAGASTGTIAVTTGGGTATSATAFKVVPTLDGFTPLSGPVGATVTLTGTGLLGATVAFGSVAATPTAVTDTTITTTVPPTAVTGKITVTTAGGTAKSAGTFTVVVAPTIKSFSPTSGPPGTTTVGLKGTGFTDLTGVSFGGVPSTSFTVTSATAATAIVPELAVTGTVTVTNAAGSATSTGVFTVIGPDPCAGVTCVALDTCHVAGTCSGGVCDNPALADGTTCNDGNPCTQTDTCQSGTCTGSNPVVCTAQDQCHAAGVCSPGKGRWTCSNPAVPDGTPCNDGNACTQTDVCLAGLCTGESPVTCVALDTCHAAGTCDPASGTCSSPGLPDGAPCNDGIACTQNDVCTGGTCAGTAYTCPAPGTPSFATSEYPANGGYPSSPVVKDVNGDGKPDVVVNCGGGIGVLLGNGDGTLQPGVDYTYGTGGNSLALADVNGDGKLDAVTFEGVLGVMVFLGNGDGTFGAPIISPSTLPSTESTNDNTWLDVGDLDGDGKPDVVAIHTWESTFAVMLGNGDGTFRAEVDYPALGSPYPGSAGFVELADFNRDGKLDALVGTVNGSSISVLLGNGDGTMGAPTDFPVDEGGLHQAIGDMNGDRLPDIVQVGDNGQVSVLLGNGDGTFLPYQAFSVGYSGGFPGLALGDFDGDGRPDVAVVMGGTPEGRVAILLGNGDGTLQAPVVLPTPAPNAQFLAAADLRGNGKVDLIITLFDASTNVAVLLNGGVSAQCVAASGTCNGDGTCSFANLPDGTACNDGNACTQADQCIGGICRGTPLTCSGATATEACTAGACKVIACAAGYADCDQQAADGCEVDLASSSSSCGSCGNACGASQTCTQGACTGASAGSAGRTLAAGELQSVAIDANGAVWASGYGLWGALGNGTGNWSDVPVQVAGLSGVIAVATGDQNSFALKRDGSVWVWGTQYVDTLTPVPFPGFSGASALAGMYHHVVMVKKSDGTVWCSGDNSAGQLGAGNGTGAYTIVPVQAIGLSNVIAVEAGLVNSMALRADGTVWAWGDNSYGELGNGTYAGSATPVQVSGLSDIVAIAGGGYHGLALDRHGSLWAWGINLYGELGNGTYTNAGVPFQVTAITNVTAIAAGEGHSLALKADGTVWTWGRNDYSQLGDGTTTQRTLPVQVAGVTGATTLGVAFYGSLVATPTGVWGWGFNDYGQLADGTMTTPRATPEQSLLP